MALRHFPAPFVNNTYYYYGSQRNQVRWILLSPFALTPLESDDVGTVTNHARISSSGVSRIMPTNTDRIATAGDVADVYAGKSPPRRRLKHNRTAGPICENRPVSARLACNRRSTCLPALRGELTPHAPIKMIAVNILSEVAETDPVFLAGIKAPPAPGSPFMAARRITFAVRSHSDDCAA